MYYQYCVNIIIKPNIVLVLSVLCKY